MNETTTSLPQCIHEARQEGIRQGKILATAKILATLTRKLNIPVQEAMILLEIPKKERKTYIRIFQGKSREV